VITRFEEISMNAWPALQTVLYDGWILRFAGGYTRRANSVNPIYHSTIDVYQKIEYCRGFYAAKGMRTFFKITSEVHPPDLDKILETKGFTREAETSVQTIGFAQLAIKDYGLVRIVTSLDDFWIDNFFRLSGAVSENKKTLKAMLRNIKMPKCFAYIKEKNVIVACGLGVLEQDVIGLFDIVVAPGFRGKGYGSRILQGILLWGKNEGAKVGYLQVMVDNKTALALYGKLGFKEMYRYWYRVQEERALFNP
jgi:GNAT superfamily N-acetyltransferase